MLKKLLLTIAGIGAATIIGFTVFGITRATADSLEFAESGYFLRGDDNDSVKHVNFQQDSKYTVDSEGRVIFTDSDGNKTVVPSDSFVYLDKGSVQALSDGVLLDFNDMSENFINNYFISRGLELRNEGQNYVADTSSGKMTFGENLWKLSDDKYLVLSPNLTVVMSEEDKRPVEGYVQVARTGDGIIQLLTPENVWMTISDGCYIQTQNGVKIYPISQIIDNNSYKLSVAKLAVDEDDSIVLSEAEQRKQTVPEINIEAIDGEDGTDGENGTEGAIGQAGAEGTIGLDGDEGAAGKEGTSGTDGTEGKAGEDGSASTQNGSTGATGKTGEDGGTGSAGSTGAKGSRGANADTESSTYNALPTMSITDWDISATDLAGVISVSDKSSMLSAIATTYGGEYKTKYPAEVRVTDVSTGETTLCYKETSEETNFYEFYEKGDGGTHAFRVPEGFLKPDRQYKLSVKAYYTIDSTVYYREFINRTFYTDSAGVYLVEDACTINTVSLTAEISEVVQDTVKSIEVTLLTPAQNAKYSNTSKSDFEYRYVVTYSGDNMTVTGKDAKDLNPETYTVAKDYSPLLTFKYHTSTDDTGKYVSGVQLPSDTSYIARVAITTTASGTQKEQLTDQELELCTLKDVPVSSGSPIASYNRVTGGVEVYRPAITEAAGGIVSFEYQAYSVVSATNSQGQYVTEYVPVTSGGTRTLGIDESEPAVFFLPSGKYVFNVYMNYNDNEKDYHYDLGRSNEVTVVGTALPKLWLRDDYSVSFNGMKGNIDISMNQESSIKVGAENPIKLIIYADQEYVDTITLTDLGEEEHGEQYEFLKATYNGTNKIATNSNASSNDYNILLSFYDEDSDGQLQGKLHANTSYTIDVEASVNLGSDYDYDTSGTKSYVHRSIGSVAFRTYSVPTLSCSFVDKTSSGGGGVVNLAVTMVLSGDPDDEKNVNYEINQASRIKVEVYNGSDMLSAPLYTTYYYSDDDGTQNRNTFTKSGGNIELDITENNFNGSFKAGNSYTINIAECCDSTYVEYDAVPQELAYENDYEISNRYANISAQKAPDAFPEEPQAAVKAEPIKNEEATKYGGIYDPDQDDDAIVGYRLSSTYNNSSQLAVQVQYYAYEYRSFYETVVDDEHDPLSIGTCPVCGKDIASGETKCSDSECSGTIDRYLLPLVKIGVDCTNDYELPKVAIFFSTDPDDENQKAGTQIGTGTSEGYYAYWGGYANIVNEKLVSGMGRGFRYLFAYTLTYTTSGSKQDKNSWMQYPNGSKLSESYQTYKDKVGIGYENGYLLGTGVAYILNSGMKRAPLVEPVPHFYVKSTDEDSLKLGDYTTGSITDAITTGKINIRYVFEDYDEVIKEDQKIYLGDQTVKIIQGNKGIKTSKTDGDYWADLQLSYDTDINGKILEPQTDTDVYRIANYYDAILRKLNLSSEIAQKDTLFSIPVSWYYGGYVNGKDADGGDYFRLEGTVTTTVAENLVSFEINAERGDISFLNTLTAQLKVDVSAEKTVDNVTTTVEKIYYIAMTPVKKADGTYKYTAEIRTDKLSDFKGLTPEYKLSLVYMNGIQGWNYSSAYYSNAKYASDGFLLRRTDSEDKNSDGTPVFTKDGKYCIQGDKLSEVPMMSSYGGLCIKYGDGTADEICSGLEDTVNTASSQRLYPYFKSADLASISGFHGRMMPDYGGVDYNFTSREKEEVGGRHVTPYAVSLKELEKVSYSGSTEITEVTPVVSSFNYQAGGISVFATSVSTSGVDGDKVYMAIYQDYEEDGEKKSGYDAAYDGIINSKAIVASGVEITIDKDGKWTKAKDESGIEIPESATGVKLDKDKTYYLILYTPTTESQKIGNVLLKSDTYKPYVRNIEVASDAKFVQIGDTDEIQIENTNYYSKRLIYVYGLESTIGLTMRYDIYSDSEVQQAAMNATSSDGIYMNDGTTPYITQEELINASIPDINVLNKDDTDYANRNMLDYPVSLSQEENTVRIYDFPNELGSRLKSGDRYYLRITAYFGSEGSKTYSNHKLVSFIMPDNDYSVHIRPKEVTKDSIEFSLVVSDNSHSVMGSMYNPPSDTIDLTKNDYTSLYTVAFDYYVEDASGNQQLRRLRTCYDNMIFSEKQLRRNFILNNDTILSKKPGSSDPVTIDPDALYIMNVYAITDYDNDGVSATASEATRKKYTFDELFGKDILKKTTLQVPGKESEDALYSEEFKNILDGFWNAGNFDYKYSDSCEKYFKVQNYSQKTLSGDSGTIIDSQGVSFTLSGNNKIMFKMRNSFGLTYTDADGNTRQTYPKIKWTVSDYISGKNYSATLKESRGDALAGNMLTRVVDDATADSYYEMPIQISGYFESGVPYTVQVVFYETEETEIVKDDLKWSAVVEP